MHSWMRVVVTSVIDEEVVDTSRRRRRLTIEVGLEGSATARRRWIVAVVAGEEVVEGVRARANRDGRRMSPGRGMTVVDARRRGGKYGEEEVEGEVAAMAFWQILDRDK